MTESGRLNGKVAVITGAASGIGEASALLFSQEGARLVLADITADSLQVVTDKITGKGGKAVMQVTDVRDATEEEVSHGHVHGPGGVQH